jgi:hypothetical protein
MLTHTHTPCRAQQRLLLVTLAGEWELAVRRVLVLRGVCDSPQSPLFPASCCLSVAHSIVLYLFCHGADSKYGGGCARVPLAAKNSTRCALSKACLRPPRRKKRSHCKQRGKRRWRVRVGGGDATARHRGGWQSSEQAVKMGQRERRSLHADGRTSSSHHLKPFCTHLASPVVSAADA